MEYTTEQLHNYAAALIAKGKELRGAVKARSRDLTRCEKRRMTESFRAEAVNAHNAGIQVILDREVAVISKEDSLAK